MRNLPLAFLFFLFLSCSTFQGENFLSYEKITNQKEKMPVLEKWPVPSLTEARLYYEKIALKKKKVLNSSLPIPPFIPRQLNLENETPSSPLVQGTKTPERVITDPVTPVVTPAPSIQEQEEPDPFLEDLSITFPEGEEIHLSLKGGGWLFKEDKLDGSLFRLKEEQKKLQETSFIFLPQEPGKFRLQFQKMDYSQGRLHILRYEVNIQASPAEVSSGLTETTEKVSTEEPKPFEDSFSKLDDETLKESLEYYEKSGELSKLILVLEEALSRSFDDEVLAGYFYKLARILEQQGKTQDLDRSYRLYQAIISQFFLSSYYDLAEDRIRYLDRHYFMLQ